jgi:hypothetical protein
MQPELFWRQNHAGDLMLIGQTLFVPGAGTPGVRYYGPWMPRQGDACTAAIQVLGQSGGGWSLLLEVQTKNQEDPDSVAGALPNTVTVATASSTSTVSNTKVKELVRCCLVCTGGGTDRWLHVRMNPMLWQPN